MFQPQDAEYWRDRPRNDPHSDWLNNHSDWIESYWLSKIHPHRELILEALDYYFNEPVESLLEIGSNCGPNLFEISQYYPKMRLAGIDINADSIILGKEKLPQVDFQIGNLLELPWPDKSFDVILADAVLMYISPKDIDQAIKEIDRVVKKGMIIIDRFSESKDGEVTGYVWGRDYGALLQDLGLEVSRVKIPDDLWPSSKNWQKTGYLFVGYHPASTISEKS